MATMQRLAAMLLVLCYAALGSGAVERWHNAQHAAEDAQLIPAARQAEIPVKGLPFHTDSNCWFHSKLHLSGLAVAWTPVLILLGLFLAVISMPLVNLPHWQSWHVIPCRGPPSR